MRPRNVDAIPFEENNRRIKRYIVKQKSNGVIRDNDLKTVDYKITSGVFTLTVKPGFFALNNVIYYLYASYDMISGIPSGVHTFTIMSDDYKPAGGFDISAPISVFSSGIYDDQNISAYPVFTTTTTDIRKLVYNLSGIKYHVISGVYDEVYETYLYVPYDVYTYFDTSRDYIIQVSGIDVFATYLTCYIPSGTVDLVYGITSSTNTVDIPFYVYSPLELHKKYLSIAPVRNENKNKLLFVRKEYDSGVFSVYFIIEDIYGELVTDTNLSSNLTVSVQTDLGTTIPTYSIVALDNSYLYRLDLTMSNDYRKLILEYTPTEGYTLYYTVELLC